MSKVLEKTRNNHLVSDASLVVSNYNKLGLYLELHRDFICRWMGIQLSFLINDYKNILDDFTALSYLAKSDKQLVNMAYKELLKYVGFDDRCLYSKKQISALVKHYDNLCHELTEAPVRGLPKKV